MSDPYENAQVFIGIDPGPKTFGLIVYAVKQGEALGTVVLADGKADPTRARSVIAALAADHPIVVLEHTHPGPPSWSMVHTSVQLGRIWEYAAIKEVQVWPAHRKKVKALLGNSDSAIRRSICELHGYDPDTLHPRHEGRLHGVSSHAWQALAAVLYHIHNNHHPITERTA
jgi:hypothetical protein